MKKFLLYLLCILAVSTASAAEKKIEVTATNSKISTNSYAIKESDELKNTNNELTGFKVKTSGTAASSKMQYRQSKNSFFIVSQNSNNYKIKNIAISGVSLSSGTLGTNHKENYYAFDNLKDITIPTTTSNQISTTTLTKNEFDIYSLSQSSSKGLDINNNYFAIVWDNNASIYQIEKIIITYDDDSSSEGGGNEQITKNFGNFTIANLTDVTPGEHPLDITLADTDGANVSYAYEYTPNDDNLTFDDNKVNIKAAGSWSVTATASAEGYNDKTTTFTISATEATVDPDPVKPDPEPAEGYLVEILLPTNSNQGSGITSVSYTDNTWDFTDNGKKVGAKYSGRTRLYVNKENNVEAHSVIAFNENSNRRGIYVDNAPNGYALKSIEATISANCTAVGEANALEVFFVNDDLTFPLEYMWTPLPNDAREGVKMENVDLSRDNISTTILTLNVDKESVGYNKSYFGLRAKKAVLYFDQIKITWTPIVKPELTITAKDVEMYEERTHKISYTASTSDDSEFDGSGLEYVISANDDNTIEEGLEVENGILSSILMGSYTVTVNYTGDVYTKGKVGEFNVTVNELPEALTDVISVATETNGLLDKQSQRYHTADWVFTESTGSNYTGIVILYKDEAGNYFGIDKDGTHSNDEIGDATHSGIFNLAAPKGYEVDKVTVTWNNRNIENAGGENHKMEFFVTPKPFTGTNQMFEGSRKKTVFFQEVTEEAGGDGETSKTGAATTTFEAPVGTRYFGICDAANSNVHYIDEIKIEWIKRSSLSWNQDEYDFDFVPEFVDPGNHLLGLKDFTTELKITNTNPEFENTHSDKIEVVVTDEEGNELDETEQQVTATAVGTDVEVVFSKPGTAYIKIKINDTDLNLNEWSLEVQETPIKITVNPAKVQFSTFDENLSINHNPIKNWSEDNTHKSDYWFAFDNETDNFMEEGKDSFYTAFLEPNFTPAVICNGDEDAETHEAHHFNAYVEPEVIHDGNSLYIAASTAGSYTLKFQVMDEYKDLFHSDSYTHSIPFDIKPVLNEDNIYVYDNRHGDRDVWYQALVKDDEGWKLVEKVCIDEENEIYEDLKSTMLYVHTGYAGDLYYRVTRKGGTDSDSEAEETESEEESSDVNSSDNAVFYAPAKAPVAIPDGYSKTTGSGIDLSNAESVSFIQVENGVMSKPTTLAITGTTPTAVETIESDSAEEAEAEYFTIEGLKATAPLAPGVYIKKTPIRAKVIFVK